MLASFTNGLEFSSISYIIVLPTLKLIAIKIVMIIKNNKKNNPFLMKLSLLLASSYDFKRLRTRHQNIL